VQFLDNVGSTAARDAINGRLFDGSTVTGVFITAQAYAGIMQNAAA
jgi:hypothetical protein